LRDKFYPEIVTGSFQRGVKQGWGEENMPFSRSMLNISKTARDWSKFQSLYAKLSRKRSVIRRWLFDYQ